MTLQLVRRREKEIGSIELSFLATETDLEQSTAMFGRLAESNAMAQILYGLALRFASPKLLDERHRL